MPISFMMRSDVTFPTCGKDWSRYETRILAITSSDEFSSTARRVSSPDFSFSRNFARWLLISCAFANAFFFSSKVNFGNAMNKRTSLESSPFSFDVLHLLAHLFQFRFRVDDAACDLAVRRLRSDCIDFTVHLLQKKIEFAANRTVRRTGFLERRYVTAKPNDLFVDVALFGHQSDLGAKSALID